MELRVVAESCFGVLARGKTLSFSFWPKMTPRMGFSFGLAIRNFARGAERKAPLPISDVRTSLVANAAAMKSLKIGFRDGRLAGPKNGLGDLAEAAVAPCAATFSAVASFRVRRASDLAQLLAHDAQLIAGADSAVVKADKRESGQRVVSQMDNVADTLAWIHSRPVLAIRKWSGFLGRLKTLKVRGGCIKGDRITKFTGPSLLRR